MIGECQFRADLYNRLSFFPIGARFARVRPERHTRTAGHETHRAAIQNEEAWYFAAIAVNYDTATDSWSKNCRN